MTKSESYPMYLGVLRRCPIILRPVAIGLLCMAWLNIQINIFRRKFNMIMVFVAGTLWCSQYWMAASRTGTRSLWPHRTPSSWPQSADPRVQVGSSNHRMASLLKCQQSRCNSYSNKRRREECFRIFGIVTSLPRNACTRCTLKRRRQKSIFTWLGRDYKVEVSVKRCHGTTWRPNIFSW